MEHTEITYRNYSSVLENPSGEFRGVSPNKKPNDAAEAIPFHKNGAREAAMNSAEYMGLTYKTPNRTKSGAKQGHLGAYEALMPMHTALLAQVRAAKTRAY
jgi:hypothetical protein